MKLFIKFFLLVFSGMMFMQGRQNNGYSASGFFGDSIYGDPKDSLINPDDSLFAVQKMLKEGKFLYEGKCGRCHELHNPKEYKLKSWKRNLEEMKYKAKLDKKEYDLILAYLSANCRK